MTGRQVLVTGSSSGMGAELCRTLEVAGEVALGLDLSANKGVPAQTAQRFRSCDIADVAQVERAVASLVAEFGPIDSLAHFAGWSAYGLFVESSREEAERTVAVNFLGTLNVVRSVLNGMLERRFGRIVLVASDAARVGVRGEAVYAGAKAAQIGFGKSLAVECARSGVTVNIVCPGTTDTPLLHSMLDEGQIGRRAKAIPMGRIGTVSDVAAAVQFFLSEQAGYITGQVLSVNGGLTRV